MLKLGVVFGGQSSEYSVSLHSVASFLRQIHNEKYDITMIGIDQNGQFYVYDGSIDDIEHDHWIPQATKAAWVHKGIMALDGKNTVKELDCVFPVLHGKNGEDGCVQGLLELMNIHYVGCDVMSSAISMDKEIMHILCDEANIPCADYVCLKANEEYPTFEMIQEKISLPWIVKPCNAGSSYGVHKVENKEEFEEACKDAFFYDGRGKILVEKVIEGFEIGCAVMGNEEVFTGSCDEIQISGGIFDFEGKYEMKGAEIICPARIDEETFTKAKELAAKTYKAMNCCGMARVDMFVPVHTPDLSYFSGPLKPLCSHRTARLSTDPALEFAVHSYQICKLYRRFVAVRCSDLFTDIANHWARENINDAAMAGWINGYPGGIFLPDQAITRAEAVTLVNNVLQRKPDADHMLDSMIKWPDNPEGAWYYEAIQEATNSHDYDLFEDAEYETWTALQENRDWAAIEKGWLDAHSA